MPNVDYHPLRRAAPFRKIAIGTWQTTYDPQVYGTLTLRMEKALAYLERFREKTGKRLTLTHLVAKAVGVAFSEMPDANAMLRFGRVYHRKSIAVFLQVAMVDPDTGKPDLSGTTLHDIDTLSLEQIVELTEKNVAMVRAREDKTLERSRKMFQIIPGWMLGWVLRVTSFFLYTLNLDLRWAGLPKDAFGSVMVTNIGSLGLDQAYAPLVPYSKVPMVLAIGAVNDEAVVEGGAIVPGKVMKVSATFDHRFIDGAHAATLVKCMHRIFNDPEGELGSGSAKDVPDKAEKPTEVDVAAT